MKHLKHLLYINLLLCCVQTTFAQEGEEKEIKKNQLTLIMSHSHIMEGIDANGKKTWITTPSWGLDYNYRISKHWAAGVHTDIVIEDFKVEEKEDNKVVDRTKPFSAVAAVAFKPKRHSSFIIGMGGEFAKEGNFLLTSLGYEYGWELPGHWELSGILTYDVKWKGYDTWVLGIGISKFF